ncbi:MAG TPA: hypothetical protein PKD83_03655 [Ignavibacteria bacterium]|nr:hypothetical protein [Ignavibacteria bacterium]
MVNTKLILLLKTLSRQETIKLKDFIYSPYFNKNQNVIRLYEEVISFYPEFDPEKCTEEKIFSVLFMNEKYNYFKLKNIISDLYQLSISFLKQIAMERIGIENEIELLNELHLRKLDNAYLKKEKQINDHLDKIMIRDEFYYQSVYKLARANTSHYKFIKSGYTFNLIQNEFDVYLQYTLIVLLRNYSKMLTHMNHGNVKFKMEMFDNILDYINNKEFENNPSSRIYKQIIAVELHKEEKDYKKLIELKDRYIENLSLEDIYYILLVANSYSVFKLKSGDESYYKDRFSILKEMIDRKIQLPEYILFVNFINTFTAACMVNEYKWTENFLKEFHKGISPAEEASNTINYCKGFLFYRKKEYDKALEYFSRTNFKLFLVKVMVKSYTVRIYYEQNLYELTFSAIDAFRHYLKSEKLISEDQKNAHYEFLKFVSELIQLKSEGLKNKGDNRFTLLKKKIREMQSNPLGAKNWLIEKSENFFS